MGRLRALAKRVPGVVHIAGLIRKGRARIALRNDKARITSRVRRVLKRRPAIFFVQIGSNDGRAKAIRYILWSRAIRDFRAS